MQIYLYLANKPNKILVFKGPNQSLELNPGWLGHHVSSAIYENVIYIFFPNTSSVSGHKMCLIWNFFFK